MIFLHPIKCVLSIGLSRDESLENKYAYYLDKVRITFDSASDISSIRVKAPTGKESVALVKDILSIAEEVVNSISSRYRDDQVKFALSQLKGAETNLLGARNNLINVQNAFLEVDPTTSVKTTLWYSRIAGKRDREY